MMFELVETHKELALSAIEWMFPQHDDMLACLRAMRVGQQQSFLVAHDSTLTFIRIK